MNGLRIKCPTGNGKQGNTVFPQSAVRRFQEFGGTIFPSAGAGNRQGSRHAKNRTYKEHMWQKAETIMTGRLRTTQPTTDDPDGKLMLRPGHLRGKTGSWRP